MTPSPADPRLPLWLRAANLPVQTRAAICVAYAVGYLVLFVATGPDVEQSLRPLNLVFVVLAGLLFGMRGGFWLSVAAVVVNLTLYWRFGLLAKTPGTFAGNMLAVA